MEQEILTISLRITNSYLIRGDGPFLMVDAGPPGSAGLFRDALRGLSIEPGEIKAILITHGHWDHWGSLAGIREHTSARVMMSRLEKDWVENAEIHIPRGMNRWGRFLSGMMKLAPIRNLMEPEGIDIPVTESDFPLDEYGIRGRILHTPGHSPGSLSLLLNSGEAFVGDLAMSGFPKLSGPGPFVVGDDPETMKKSWQKLLDLGADVIYPAHGKPFHADVFRKYLKTGRT